MRMLIVLAAMLAALGMPSQAAEAGDRGFGFRHFSPNAGAKLHRPHHGRSFHHGFPGKHSHFKSRRFDHFGHRGLGLKFGNGDFVLKFGHVPHFKPRHFGHRHRPPGLFFGFDRPRHFSPWHDRSFGHKDRHGVPWQLRRFHGSIPPPKSGFSRSLHGGPPPEALLRHLERMGFRDVPGLLRKQRR